MASLFLPRAKGSVSTWLPSLESSALGVHRLYSLHNRDNIVLPVNRTFHMHTENWVQRYNDIHFMNKLIIIRYRTFQDAQVHATRSRTVRSGLASPHSVTVRVWCMLYVALLTKPDLHMYGIESLPLWDKATICCILISHPPPTRFLGTCF